MSTDLAKRNPPGVVATSPVMAQVLYGPNNQPISVITPEGVYPFPAGAAPATAITDRPPRAFVPAPFMNMLQRPRVQPGMVLTAFPQLRALADFDLVRIVIEALKGHCKGLVYEAVARQEFEDDPGVEKQIDTARRWMEVPDRFGRIEWDDWIGLLLEETLVTDALSIVPRHTKGGEFAGLEIIDGATIKPLVDDRGRSPLPPSPAFQQIAHGRVETNQLNRAPLLFDFNAKESQFYSARIGNAVDNELWYWPRNRRARTLYGQSEVERVLMTVNQAIRNSVYELSYFTTGNLPDSLYSVPENWGRTQIEEFQEIFDGLTSGVDEKRAGALRFVPDGKYIPTKTQQWQYEYVEFLARVIAWAFSVSALPIMKQVGRNPSEVLQSSAISAGVKPLTKFICRVTSRALRDELKLDKVMVQVANNEAEAPEIVYQRNIAYAKAGMKTWNSALKDAGEDPVAEGWADKLMLVGQDGTTVVFLDAVEQKIKDDAANAKAAADALAAGKVGPAKIGEPSATASSGPATKGQIALQGYSSRVRDELSKARRYALKRAAKGMAPLDGFEFFVTPPVMQKRIKESLGVAA